MFARARRRRACLPGPAAPWCRAVSDSLVPPGMMTSLRAVAETIFAGHDAPPPKARIDWLLAEFEDYLDRAGSRPILIMRLALFAVTWLAPLFIGALPTLGRLPHARRVMALTRMEESFASAPVLAVKAFLCVLYYEHPDVQREVGYVGFGGAEPPAGARP